MCYKCVETKWNIMAKKYESPCHESPCQVKLQINVVDRT